LAAGILEAEAALTKGLGKCTQLHAQNAAAAVKFRLSLPKASQSTAGIVSGRKIQIRAFDRQNIT